MLVSPFELAVHRDNTTRFIEDDPTEITLIPRETIWNAGTKSMVDGLPRAPQKFKIIWGSGNGVSGQGVLSVSSGTTREFSFTLVGNWDAVVAIGDHWKIGNQDFEIEWVMPFNGYEVKCGGTSHGAHPLGGPNSC